MYKFSYKHFYINTYFILYLFDKWTLHCFCFQLRVFQTVYCTEAVIDAVFTWFCLRDVRESFIAIDCGQDNHKQKYRQHSSVQAEVNLRFLPVTKCFSPEVPVQHDTFNLYYYNFVLPHNDNKSVLFYSILFLNIGIRWEGYSSPSGSRRSRRGRKSWDSIGTRREKKKQKKERCSNFAEIRQALASIGCWSNPNHNPLNHLRRSSKCGAHTPGTPLSYV